MRRALLAIAILSSLVACKQRSSEPAKAESPTLASKPVEADSPAVGPATINALVPAKLADKLTFATRELTDQFKFTFSLAAPADWVQAEGFATVHPPGEEAFGSAMRISKTCAGVCTPKDWAAVTEKEEFASMRSSKLLEDKLSATSHLVIAEANEVTVIKYAWWKPDASRYAICSATLKAPYREAAPAFAKACQAVASTGRE